MFDFKEEVKAIIATIPDITEPSNITLVAIEHLTQVAGFNTQTKDSAIFAVMTLLSVKEGLPTLDTINERIGWNEYGRAAVAGYRYESLSHFYMVLQTSINDGLIPLSAWRACKESKMLGFLAFHFYPEFKKGIAVEVIKEDELPKDFNGNIAIIHK